MKQLYLLRGLPGSGKSTLASTLNGIIYSTDEFFTHNGEYRHSLKLLSLAHSWNQARVVRAMAIQEIPIIVVDNTNVCLWEMAPYINMAKEYGYELSILEPETLWWKARDLPTLAQKTKHNVPLAALERMHDKWEII